MTNRRQFLASCSATGLLACTSSLLADNSQARPSLGFSLYGMKNLPLGQALHTCSKIGYSHVELALNEGYQTQPEQFSQPDREAAKEQLQQLKLQCLCLMIHLNLTADEKSQLSYLKQIQQAAELAVQLNPNNPPILETVLGGSPATWDKQKSLMVDNLHRWADAARASNASIAVKAHIRSAVNSPERLLWLVDQVGSPAVLVAYDYSHFELQGIGLRESMSALVPHAKFIHVKDTTGTADKFEFLLPGSGRTDYGQYFSLLREFRYAGPVCVEVSSQVFSKPDYDPAKAAQSSFDALNPHMLKAFSA